MSKRSKSVDYVYSDGSITDRPLDFISKDVSLPRLVLCYGYDGTRQQLKVEFFIDADTGVLEKILTADTLDNGARRLIEWMSETGNICAGTYEINKLEKYVADKAG